MRVHEVMSKSALACRADANLAEVARIMEQRECGFVPLTDASGRKIVGVLTDRDICLAAYRLHAPLTDILASSAMSKHVHGCTEEDDISHAMEIMRRHLLHRLPVLDAAGRLVGILSIEDLARVAGTKGKGPSQLEICETLKAITTPHPRATPGSMREGEATKAYSAPEVE